MGTEHVYAYVERPDVVSVLPPGIDRLLDVGCSRGGFASSVRKAGAARNIWGIESDPRVAQEARHRFDTFVSGTYPHDLPEGATFDCVAFNDVLEHLEDPWGVLRSTRDRLTNRGVIVASIPNIRFIPVVLRLALSGDFTYTDTGVMDRTHLRFFTRKTMMAMFEDTGYRVISVTPSNAWRDQEWLARVAPSRFRDAVHRQFIIVAKPG